MYQVTSMEDYLEQHKYTMEEKRAANFKRCNTPLMTPVAVSAHSSKNAIALNYKVQVLGLPQPQFEYGGSTLEGWNAKTEIQGEVLEENRLCNSKQEAKELVCGRALELIARLEQEGSISKSKAEQLEPNFNYVGMLQEYQASISLLPPTYQDYQLGIQWYCTATVKIDGVDQTFGSVDTPFSSKKLARQHAAQAAVLHLKSFGKWPVSTKKTKNKKELQLQLSPSANTTPDDNLLRSSYASQVAQLAVTLGLPTPEWRFESDGMALGVHTVTCLFKNGGTLEGPLGEARHVLGKKAAKEECARSVVKILNEELGRRMAHGKKLMAAAAVPLGELAAAGLDDDSDDEEFEDAEDHLKGDV